LYCLRSLEVILKGKIRKLTLHWFIVRINNRIANHVFKLIP